MQTRPYSTEELIASIETFYASHSKSAEPWLIKKKREQFIKNMQLSPCLWQAAHNPIVLQMIFSGWISELGQIKLDSVDTLRDYFLRKLVGFCVDALLAELSAQHNNSLAAVRSIRDLDFLGRLGRSKDILSPLEKVCFNYFIAMDKSLADPSEACQQLLSPIFNNAYLHSLLCALHLESLHQQNLEKALKQLPLTEQTKLSYFFYILAGLNSTERKILFDHLESILCNENVALHLSFWLEPKLARIPEEQVPPTYLDKLGKLIKEKMLSNEETFLQQVAAVREILQNSQKADPENNLLERFLYYLQNDEQHLNNPLSYAENALFEAVKKNNPKKLEKILAEKINPDVRNAAGETPLYIAATYPERRWDTLDLLLRKGANPDLIVNNKTIYESTADHITRLILDDYRKPPSKTAYIANNHFAPITNESTLKEDDKPTPNNLFKPI